MTIIYTPEQAARIAGAAAAILQSQGDDPEFYCDRDDELVRGDMSGWADVARRFQLNFSEWSAATELAMEQWLDFELDEIDAHERRTGA